METVLDNLYRNLDYRVESVENRLFGLRYGAAFIAQTQREDEILEYEDSDLHQVLEPSFQ